jgi:hypothetical protein
VTGAAHFKSLGVTNNKELVGEYIRPAASSLQWMLWRAALPHGKFVMFAAIHPHLIAREQLSCPVNEIRKPRPEVQFGRGTA